MLDKLGRMKAHSSLVTAIALCYNHSRFLIECLESIRAQTFQDFELIIMDDCSTDNSVELIQNWIKSHQINCRFIAHSVNKGICATLNEAILLANGKYIAQIATDDLWLPRKLEIQVTHMEQLPEDVGVLYSDAESIDEKGVFLRNVSEGWNRTVLYPEGDILADLLLGSFFAVCSTLIRRSCYEKVGMYDERLAYEDYDMMLRIAGCYHFAFSPYISGKWRVVSNSLLHILLNQRMQAFQASEFLTFEKCIESQNLNPYQKKLACYRLSKTALALYKLQHEKRGEYLLKSLKYGLSFKCLIALILYYSFSADREKKVMNFLVSISKGMKFLFSKKKVV